MQRGRTSAPLRGGAGGGSVHGPGHLAAGREEAEFHRCQFEHRFEQPDLRVTNGELGRVHADGNSPCPGRQVIAHEAALAALVQSALRIQGERAGGDNHPAQQGLMNLGLDRNCHKARSQICAAKGHERNTKHQTPNTRKAPNLKFQGADVAGGIEI